MSDIVVGDIVRLLRREEGGWGQYRPHPHYGDPYVMRWRVLRVRVVDDDVPQAKLVALGDDPLTTKAFGGTSSSGYVFQEYIAKDEFLSAANHAISI